MSIWPQYNNRSKAAPARERERIRRKPLFRDLIAKLAVRAAQRLRRHRLVASIAKDDPSAKLRADIYYPIIARALEQLPRNECEARQKLYDRARAMLTSKLHGQDNSLVAHERRALEMAIRRAEVQANLREIISQKHSVADQMETTTRHTED